MPRRLICVAIAAALGLPLAVMAAGDELLRRNDLSPADAERVATVTRPATDFSKAEKFEPLSAGAATTRRRRGRDSYSSPLPALKARQKFDFVLGESLFEKLWVSSPATTRASDGLGPLFNARACSGCHPRDGRGTAPDASGNDGGSLILHLSVPPRSEAERHRVAQGHTLPDPTYGRQLQERAVPGLAAEGTVRVSYQEIPVALAGGETASLRQPTYHIEGLNHGPVDPALLVSPRLAPALPGLGLLEQIHPADILALADPDDADGDGISGRPNRVPDPETGNTALGRYGWKATLPSVRSQSADAFSGDIGISTPLYPAAAGDCTAKEPECLAMPSGVDPHLGDVEAPDPVLALVSFYVANLAVPARRDAGDAEVLAGKKQFYEAGCVSCHRPKFVTRRDSPDPAHRFQLIWPYSDLLLHDMGPGLADGRPAGEATGREWRTAPLWGIGLAKTVNPDTGFLHDGRARTLLEAILWHGGEAARAKDAVVAMEPKDRAALIRFLESL